MPPTADTKIIEFIRSISKQPHVNFDSVSHFSPTHLYFNPEIAENQHTISKIKFIYTKTQDIPIDVFINYRRGNELIHGSPYNFWVNTNYELNPMEYQSNVIYIPGEKYLEENYGEWRKPQVNYQYYLCPNYEPPLTACFLFKLFKVYLKLKKRGRLNPILIQRMLALLKIFQKKIMDYQSNCDI